MTPAVLVPLHAGFEEIETVTPIDLFRRAEIEVTVAACGTDLWVPGRCGMRLQADVVWAELPERIWEAIVVPGGPAVMQGLRSHPQLRALLVEHAKAGRWIGAICAAPLVLHDAGLLEGRRFTAHPSALVELGDPVNGDVVEDDWLITSRGAGTAIPFSLALIRALRDASVAGEVAQSICWPNG